MWVAIRNLYATCTFTRAIPKIADFPRVFHDIQLYFHSRPNSRVVGKLQRVRTCRVYCRSIVPFII